MNKKKLFSLAILVIFLFSSMLHASASSVNSGNAVIEIEYLDDGSYFETIVQAQSLAKTSSIIGNKTLNYKNSSGEALWSVTVYATFSYLNGVSCNCTTVSGSSVSYNSSWTVTSATTNKSANKASASATGKHYSGSTLVESISKTVTLTCDTYGNLS
ncbi:MAG: hypothetical protein LUG56_05355 [Lachnospiraceae bacterium]|nr:hypothetical protein [Lachnospiraceae bacterium]MCD7841880.1 hypothetical protein [Lachnospiraceae bacterium]